MGVRGVGDKGAHELFIYVRSTKIGQCIYR